jgi:hypothetical protein
VGTCPQSRDHWLGSGTYPACYLSINIGNMELFSREADSNNNLLPYDGMVQYYGPVMPPGDARYYLEVLLNQVEWRHDEAVIFGRHIITKRKVAWYGDEEYAYTYSKGY